MILHYFKLVFTLKVWFDLLTLNCQRINALSIAFAQVIFAHRERKESGLKVAREDMEEALNFNMSDKEIISSLFDTEFVSAIDTFITLQFLNPIVSTLSTLPSLKVT